MSWFASIITPEEILEDIHPDWQGYVNRGKPSPCNAVDTIVAQDNSLEDDEYELFPSDGNTELNSMLNGDTFDQLMHINVFSDIDD
ncbi:hypothetical protein [Motilimonas eburnea]|uniref:hypothetical protein n=1 Tax=Motilimonas eburnea TaxID=1737488 RepID=UPI001E2AD52E|nr:hypothetical protein [Motilimonas eburnea]MCE2571735.1 hypothetical protein [Motilimonas eburnea]